MAKEVDIKYLIEVIKNVLENYHAAMVALVFVDLVE